MTYIVCGIVGYILGSFPTAYIYLKKYSSKNITEEGSGNVGAMNSFNVSGSKIMGLAVLTTDALKGFLSVWIVFRIFGEDFTYGAISLTAAVLAHCYSPWIKFKGGRGLATAAGGALLLNIPILIVWIVFWIASFLFRKSIHLSNIMATILSIAIVVYSAGNLNKWGNYPTDNLYQFIIPMVMIFLIIFVRHIEPLKEYISGLRQNIKED